MRHWLWPKSANTPTRVESRIRLFDDAVGLQIPQMAAQRRRVEVDRVGDLAGSPRTSA
jgi:hypothetical protein